MGSMSFYLPVLLADTDIHDDDGEYYEAVTGPVGQEDSDTNDS